MYNSRCGPGTSMPLLVKITLKVHGLGWLRCQYPHELKDCHYIDFRYHIISTKSLSSSFPPSWLSSNLVTNEIIITIVVTMLSLTQLTWNMITNMIIITIVVITSSLTRLASNMITNMIIMSSGQGKGGLGEATGAVPDTCIRTEGKMAESIGITEHFH